jgi:hypothetical protein
LADSDRPVRFEGSMQKCQDERSQIGTEQPNGWRMIKKGSQFVSSHRELLDVLW